MSVSTRAASLLLLGCVWLAGLPAAASASFFSTDSIARLAPEVIFHRDEDFHPTSGKDFLDHAGLAFSYDNGCAPFYWHRRVKAGRVNRWSGAEVAAVGEGTPVARLRSPKSSGCKPLPGAENAFSTSDLTRPRQGGRDGRLRNRDGWYLDLANDQRSGFRDTVPGDDQYETRAPTYFDDGLLYSNGRPTGFAFVTYWFFYAYDDGLSKQNHEGDWENVSIKLEHAGGERWRPIEVFYAKHGKEGDVLPGIAPTRSKPAAPPGWGSSPLAGPMQATEAASAHSNRSITSTKKGPPGRPGRGSASSGIRAGPGIAAPGARSEGSTSPRAPSARAASTGPGIR